MSNEITVERRGDALVPVAESFRQDLLEYPEKRQLVISVRIAEEKTDEMRAWLWYLVKKLREAGAWDGDSESLMDHLKIHAGYFATIAGAPTFPPEIVDLAQGLLDEIKTRREAVAESPRWPDGPQSVMPESLYDGTIETLARAIVEAGPRVHFVPKSIARGAITHQNMSRLVERIEHYIGSEWGIDVSEFKKKRQEATGSRTETPTEASKPEPTTRQQLEASTLYEALCAFGFELAMIDKWDMPGVDGLKGYWDKAKKTKRIKHLYEIAPKAMKALYELAELNARGMAIDYDDSVRAIAKVEVEDAMRERIDAMKERIEAAGT